MYASSRTGTLATVRLRSVLIALILRSLAVGPGFDPGIIILELSAPCIAKRVAASLSRSSACAWFSVTTVSSKNLLLCTLPIACSTLGSRGDFKSKKALFVAAALTSHSVEYDKSAYFEGSYVIGISVFKVFLRKENNHYYEKPSCCRALVQDSRPA